MNVRQLLASRWFHSVVIAIFVGLVLFPVYEPYVSRPELVDAVLILLAWMFGARYQRSLMIESGLVEETDLKKVERDAEGFLR